MLSKDVLYNNVAIATFDAGRSVADKAIEELKELIEQCEIAVESLQANGTIQNSYELQDEMADVACVTEQVTGELYFIQKQSDRFSFKIDKLEYRLKNGGLFK